MKIAAVADLSRARRRTQKPRRIQGESGEGRAADREARQLRWPSWPIKWARRRRAWRHSTSNGTTGRTPSSAPPVSFAISKPPRGSLARSHAKDGDVEKALAGAAKTIEAVYQVPFLAHATMEPMNCTVRCAARRPARCGWERRFWRGLRPRGEVTGLPKEKVKVHNHLIGGGFGRRLDRMA